MIITKVKATNFGSYKEACFDPHASDLCLVSGPTGAGKSTIPDMVAWGLFGITAKNGNADDVISWSAPEDGTTVAITVLIEGKGEYIFIRERGGKGKNDLFWITEGKAKRGKDMLDTQKCINSILGVEPELYLSAAYFSEFSPTAGFFLANAKQRRAVLEQVTDLSFPVKIATAATDAKKAVKAEIKSVESQLARLEGAFEQATNSYNRAKDQESEWVNDNARAIEIEKIKSAKFEETKASKIDALTTKHKAFEDANQREHVQLASKLQDTTEKLQKAEANHISCETCGTVKGAEEVARLKGAINVLNIKIDTVINAINPFEAQLERAKQEVNQSYRVIEDLKAQTNPHTKYVKDLQKRLDKQEEDLLSTVDSLNALTGKLSSLDQIYDLSFALRGVLLNTAVKAIEDSTNKSLETYFDSAFRVTFNIDDGDSLEVSIYKDGYPCVYRQLSKGQRQLLKLCFATSIMKAAANSSGIYFNELFFDEALDGLDVSLKVKAFDLFADLAKDHGSVFLIDHAVEFQELFSSKWKVKLLSGEESTLEINS